MNYGQANHILQKLKDEESAEMNYYDGDGNLIATIGASAPLVMDCEWKAFTVRQPSVEILTVTKEGEFQWHPDAERLIAEGDFAGSAALQHILRKLWSVR